MQKNLICKETLQERLTKTIGSDHLTKTNIPLHITDNLNQNKKLRTYQQNALRYYLNNFQHEKFKQKHLMFNMATGSGKTLLMAALILDCFQKGYNQFLFFVSSTSVLEKTKDNFNNPRSAKYLFSQKIIINGKNIKINVIQNWEEAQENAINIIFATTQGLYSLFTKEKENNLTLDDFQQHKIVFLADEAHHLNSSTKKALSKTEESAQLGWEYIINQAFLQNKNNLIFEFTATIPNYETVADKYTDKIIFEYNLKSFYEEKYSKKIFLLKYENNHIHHRFLGAICLNIYRQLLAFKFLPENRSFKPIILFKSESIPSSKQYQKDFFDFIKNLKEKDIKNFYLYINDKNQNLLQNEELLVQSKIFFQEYFGKNFESFLVEIIQSTFTEKECLNVNDKDIEKLQLQLNSLEELENPIRVIFAVDKLNEGWDVLNLFDIVRTKTLKNERKQKKKDLTTKEAQLIGRGARYYPFYFKENNPFQRKFDEEQTPLAALESLGYHTINEVDFISELNKELENLGLQQTENKKVVLNLNQKAKKMLEEGKTSIPLALNSIDKEKGLLNDFENNLKNNFKNNIFKENEHWFIPLLNTNHVEETEAFKNDEKDNHPLSLKKQFSLKEIPIAIWQKALNQTQNLDFKKIKKQFKFSSRLEFIQMLQNKECIIHQNQNDENKEIKLNIALFVLEKVLNQINEKQNNLEKNKNYKVLDFKINYEFKLESPREIWTKKKAKNFDFYDWLVYDQCLLDSGLEKEFLEFIANNKSILDETFKNWLIIRNEQYENLALYDNNKQSACYAERFFPDFVFWAELKNGENVAVECFIEPKGEVLIQKDKWKENLLKSLCLNKENPLENKKDKIYLEGLCFYRTNENNNNEEFEQSFYQFINKYKNKN